MFTDYRAFQKFQRMVQNSSRYALDQDSISFLSIFENGVMQRVGTIKMGTLLVRAIRDFEEQIDENEAIYNLTGVSEDRIIPKPEYVNEGRINPSGIPVLYLASSIETAVSEVRPWIGETISIAKLSIVKDLRIVDLSKGYGEQSFSQLSPDELFGAVEIPKEKANKCVWIDIDNAFSTPMTRTDTGAEYAPTQILSEVIRNLGFDGVVYKSSFGGERGYNVALFKINDAKVVSCAPFEIDEIKIEYKQCGNEWFKK